MSILRTMLLTHSLLPFLANAQTAVKPVVYRVSTVAGIPWTVDGPATAPNIMLKTPFGVAVAADGTIYVALYDMHLVRKIGPDGTSTVVAGDGTDSRTAILGTSPETAARRLTYPRTLALDGDRYLYIGEPVINRIKRVDLKSGGVETVAGGNGAGFSPDGTVGTTARLNEVLGLAVDSRGDLLIAETGSHRIRVWSPSSRLLTTIAGSGTAGNSGDGAAALSATLNRPSGIAVAGDSVYFYDLGNRRIRRIRGGTITASGGASTGSASEGPASLVNFGDCTFLAADPAGNHLYVASESLHRIFKIQLNDMTVTAVTGTGAPGRPSDGARAAQSPVFTPLGMAVDPQGALYYSDYGNHQLRRIAPDGTTRRAAGLSRFGLEGSVEPLKAVFDGITSISVSPQGQLTITENANCLIRTMTATVVSIAYGAQGTCLAALSTVTSAVLDGDRNLFFLNRSGLSYRPASAAQPLLRNSTAGGGLALSPDGAGLYYTDAGLGAIYSVPRASAIAGAANAVQISGIGGPGLVNGPLATARFQSPTHIAFAPNGDYYVADFTAIRKVQAGNVSTLPCGNVCASTALVSGTLWGAGVGKIFRFNEVGDLTSWLGPGPAETGFSPDGVVEGGVRFGRNGLQIAAGPNGTAYIADPWNHVIRQAVPVTIDTFEIVQGDEQTALLGSPLTVPMQVRVTGADGLPIEGLVVAFFTPPDYRINTIASTNAQGIATAPALPIPDKAGEYSLSAVTATNPESNRLVFRYKYVEPGPAISSISVVPEYGASSPVGPGSRVAIRGRLLANTAGSAPDGAPSIEGTSVTMNGLAAVLLSVAPDAIECVVPEALGPGPVEVVVTKEGVSPSGPFALDIPARAPAILTPPDLEHDGKRFAFAVIETGELAAPAGLTANSRPAKAGERLSFLVTGAGSPPAAVSVRFGEAEPVAAEFSPGALGTWRVVAVIPEGVSGDVPVHIAFDGVSNLVVVYSAIE